jgi:predicted RNase H-like HicB family nuclease
MSTFIGLIYKSRSGYDIVVPDAPGCTASDDTLRGVIQAGTQALRLWAEAEVSAGRSIPKPRKEDDRELKAEIDDCISMAMLPLYMDDGRIRRINITMEAWLLNALDGAAKQSGLTRSAFIASAAREKLQISGAAEKKFPSDHHYAIKKNFTPGGPIKRISASATKRLTDAARATASAARDKITGTK